MHLLLKLFILVKRSLHVSDGLSTQYQELKAAHSATGICQTAAPSGEEMELSFELLVMDGKTVRNM